MAFEPHSEQDGAAVDVTTGGYFERAVRRWRAGHEALGERLLVLGEGALAGPGIEGSALCLDRQGLAILVVSLSTERDRQPEALADELARIAALSESELAEVADLSPEGLRRLHAELFGLDERRAAQQPLNADQRVVLLCDHEPSVAWWSDVAAEVGPRLEEVYLVQDGVADALRAGGQMKRRASFATLAAKWGTVAVAALAAAALAVALGGGFDREEPQLPVISGLVSTVTAGVPGDATHTQWSGQHHLVRTSDDRLHVLYASAGRLHVVTDRRDGGRSWEEAVAVPEIQTTGYSAAVDGQDRLLLASTDDEVLRFVVLTRETTGWEPGKTLVLDARPSSRVVDIAWDPRAEVAHVVWAATDGSGERVRWAAVRAAAEPRLVQSGDLAPAGGTGTALTSVTMTRDGQVLAVYRRTDRGGFFSRTARVKVASSRFEWQPEEVVTPDGSFGSVSLVVDRRGIAHLALRDDLNPSLRYFRKPPRRPWGRGEVAVAGRSTEEVDFPALSVDEASGLVYLFFQNADVVPSPQIRVLVRDPVEGWLGSYQVITPGAVPDGATFPIAAGNVTGSASVLWTREGPIPQIQLARFLAP